MTNDTSICSTCQTPLEKRGSGLFCPACMLRGFMDDIDVEAETQITEAPAAGDMPRVPRHSMIEKIGEGGFANVFRAMQREPVKREVAIKVLKPQVASYHVLARFETERQTLARMEHPGIARLWDSGVTMHGQPFFAMELVRGEPVTSYCERHDLSLDERLEIFCSICDAVQHAHEKGVLHRDLKPSNILVAGKDDERVVKIIDFGIAKALELTPETADERETGAMTSIHQAVGTPGYMSPEQSAWGAHHVDARSDLYALGVVLYELITGKTPLQVERRANEEARQWPVAKHVTPPSQLAKSLLLTKTEKRDLDAITLKALDMDSTRRYASAAAFAEDIQRHLHDEPVLAGDRSWTYVMEKFTRRHLPFVVSAGVAVVAVTGGFTASTILYFKEQKARAKAEDAQNIVQAREAQLRRTLSRADFTAAQQFKAAGDAQSAVACLARALRQDPQFGAAAADLQMMLVQDDSPQPVETVIPVDPAWGDVQENFGAVSASGHTLAAVFVTGDRHRLMLFHHANDQWQRREIALKARLRVTTLAAAGNLLAIAEEGQDVRLLRPEEPAFEHRWTPPSPVTVLTATTATEIIAAGCEDGSVWYLSTQDDLPPKRLGKLDGAVTALSIAPRRVIAAGKGGEVRRLTVGEREENELLIKLPGEITVIAQNGGLPTIAAGDSLGNVAWRGVADDAQPMVHKLHEATVTALTLGGLPARQTLLSAGGARDLRVRWTDLTTQEEIKEPVESAGAVRRIVMTRSGDGALIVSADASVRMWRESAKSALTVRKPQRARFTAMSTQGRALAVRRDLGRALEVLLLPQDTMFGVVLDRGRPPLPGVNGRACAAFCGDSKTLVETNEIGVAGLWDAGEASLIGSARWPQAALALMPMGTDKMLAALADGSLIEACTDGSTFQQRLPAAPGVPWTLAAISPDGRGAVWATSSPDLQQQCRLRVWWEGEAEPRELKAERLSCVAVHAGTRAIALGMGNGHVRVLREGEEARVGGAVPLHQSTITSLAFSADGQALITGSTDRSTVVWETGKLTPLTDAFRFDSAVQRVAFSGDGCRFACVTESHVVVGDVEARALLGGPFVLPNLGRTLALNHDGTRLAFAIGNGNTFVHEIAPAPAVAAPEWFLKLAETYVTRRMTSHGTIEVMDHPGLDALREIVKEKGDDTWGRFATWMFTHPGLRTLTPWSELTLESYLTEVQKRPTVTREIEMRRLRTLRYRPAEQSADPPVP